MEQATNRKLKRERWPKKPMPSGKPNDMLTWEGVREVFGNGRMTGFMTGVFDVLKTVEH